MGAACCHSADAVKDPPDDEATGPENLQEEEVEERKRIYAQQIAAEKERHAALCRKVVQRMMQSHLAAAFDRYAESVATRREQREVVRRVVGRMLHQKLAMAWERFVAGVEEAREYKERVQQVLGRWMQPALSDSLLAWRELVEREREERKEQEHAAANALLAQELAQERAKLDQRIAGEQERHAALCRKVVQRMMQSHLAAAFDRYAESVATRREQREVVRRVVGRMLHQKLAMAWERFVAGVEEAREYKERVQQVLGRWMQPALSDSLLAWRELVEREREEKREEANEEARALLALERTDKTTLQQENEALQQRVLVGQERHAAMCRRVLQRMLKGNLAAAFDRYAEAVAVRAEQREVARRVLGRIRHLALAVAWDRLLEGLECLREPKREAMAVFREKFHKKTGQKLPWALRIDDTIPSYKWEGTTALHVAAYEGWGDVAGALLDAGARPDARHDQGYTALHMAAMNGHVQIVRQLLRRRADPSLATEKGETALFFALGNGRTNRLSEEVVRLLQGAGGVA